MKTTNRNSMELLDRYLQAVGFWLPKAQQQDIIAELSEDLRSQIEEKEAGLGRSLNETELDAILKQRGRPVLVANRYLPQRSLIGPVLFPIYLFVVKLVASFYLLPWILVWIGLMSFSSSYRAEHTSAGWLNAIGSAWSAWWLIALFALGGVTLVFAILEQVQTKSRFLEDWNPRKLPPARNPNQIARSGSVIEVVVNLMFGIWWIDVMSTLVPLSRPEIRIVLSPVWRYFFWGFLVLALINAVLAAANLARPYWTVLRAGFRLATNVTASALFCWMAKASLLAEIGGANIPLARRLDITNAINLGVAKVFPVVLATGVVIAVIDVRRILRVRNAAPAQFKAVSAAVV
ncbi:MAG TPA: hypothetical protein VE377_24470 [Candidatus Dormibacteraeota bacterium]|nr:hypothetical protein [Candidatus Dormibacteraeota bacterium]